MRQCVPEGQTQFTAITFRNKTQISNGSEGQRSRQNVTANHF